MPRNEFRPFGLDCYDTAVLLWGQAYYMELGFKYDEEE